MMPPPPGPPFAPPPRRRSGDVVATAVLGALLAVAALVGLYLSLFFVMATDSCGINDCTEWLLVAAYGVAWGGIGVAALGALLGVLMASRRGTWMWIWPAVGLVLVPAAVTGGALLASAVVA